MTHTTRAQELVGKLEGDPGLLHRLRSAPTGEGKQEVLREVGFSDLRREDFDAYLRDAGFGSDLTSDELSDEELEAVAGGLSSTSGGGSASTAAAGVAASVAAVA